MANPCPCKLSGQGLQYKFLGFESQTTTLPSVPPLQPSLHIVCAFFGTRASMLTTFSQSASKNMMWLRWETNTTLDSNKQLCVCVFTLQFGHGPQNFQTIGSEWELTHLVSNCESWSVSFQVPELEFMTCKSCRMSK